MKRAVCGILLMIMLCFCACGSNGGDVADVTADPSCTTEEQTPQARYEAAMAWMEIGEYEKALAAFPSPEAFSDSER